MLGTTLFILSTVFVQQTMDFTAKLTPSEKGHAYLDQSMPEGIKLKTLDGKPYILKVDTPTLVQVWSVCCGGDTTQWADQRYTEQVYTKRGLRVISINLENGKDGIQQKKILNDFFKTKPKPNELYLDTLGYAYDELSVRGFPTFILINKDGKLIFRTGDKSKEGMALLESEIQNLLDELND